MHTLTLAWIDHWPVRLTRRATRVREAPQPTARILSLGQVLGISHALGRVVVCERGCLWLTFDGDPRDVIVRAGQQHRCDRDTRMTIEALEVTQLQVR